MTKKAGQRVRRRRAAGWALLGVCAGVVAVWVWGCSFRVARGEVSVGGGQVEVVWGDEDERNAFRLENLRYFASTNSPRLWPGWLIRTQDATDSFDSQAFRSDVLLVRFPVWSLFAATGASGCFLLWRTGEPWRGRRRIWAGVACAAVGAWLGGLWAWSGWGFPSVNLAPARVMVFRGVAFVDVDLNQRWQLPIGDMFQGPLTSFGTSGRWVLWRLDVKGGMLRVTLWPVSAALLGGGAVLARRGWVARRRHAGGCVACGYDLAGLDDEAVCPECGEGKAA